MTIDEAIAACGDFQPATLAAIGFKRQDVPLYAVMVKDWPTQLLGRDDMYKLGLGVWRNDEGWWLLGTLDTTLHPHERWLYIARSHAEVWYQINPHATNSWDVDNLRQLLASRLDDLQYNRLTRVDDRKLWTSSVHWRTVNHKPNTLDALLPALLDTRLTPEGFHNLVYHYDTWASIHPEAAGLPRELVWRMYGLGEAAQLAAMNRAARMQGLWDDDAFMFAGELSPSRERRR